MKFPEILERTFFPVKCPVCNEIVPIYKSFCDCQGDGVKKISKDYCRHCGVDKDKCRCGITGQTLSDIAGVYYYSGEIRSEILLFKFSGQRHFYKDFSLAMSERAAQVYHNIKFDAATFVPTTKSVIKERGFNPGELLSKGVAEKLFIPFESILIKIRETEKQHTLSEKERLKNLDGAIKLINGTDVKGKTILLCDDVKTTGTTLRKCSEALYEGGAKRVCCLVLAVTDYFTDF